jgi:hypothetical protein
MKGHKIPATNGWWCKECNADGPEEDIFKCPKCNKEVCNILEIGRQIDRETRVTHEDLAGFRVTI